MKFSIGDKIVLKRTGEEGHVAAYINDQMLEVEVNGITFPVHYDEIDHPYLKWFTEKRKEKKGSQPEQLPVEKEQFKKPRLAKGIYLSFLPFFKSDEMEDIVDYIKIYLLNELPVSIRFIYDVRFAHQSEFRHEGALHAFGDLYLHKIAFEDMNDQPRFHWQFTDVANAENEVEEGVLRIRPAKLFEHITEVLKNNEPTFSYLLIEDFVPRKKRQPKEKFEPVIKPSLISLGNISSRIEPVPYEIDLHIEKLIDDPKGLSNTEMLKIQLDALERYLHTAIVNRQERVVIIHGLGKGALKKATHNLLSKIPEVKKFANEWHGKYGFGATEVFFKY